MALLLIPVAVIIGRAWELGPSCASVQGRIDPRFVGSILEWIHLHLLGDMAIGGSIWSPPFFFPAPNVLAYSENFFAGYLFYAPLRWIGVGPSAALFVFHVMQLALTPVVSYLCLRRLRFGRWPSLVASAVFSWGWVHFYHYGHVQFSARYPVPVFFTALYLAVHRRQPWALVVAAWAVVFTVHFSLNTAVLVVGGVLALALSTLLVPGAQAELSSAMRAYSRFTSSHPRQLVAIVLLCVVAIALVVPTVTMYREVHHQLGGPSKAEVRHYWGDIVSWVRPPVSHPVLGGVHDRFPSATGGVWEKHAFMGWLSLIALLLPTAGLAVRWKRIYRVWSRSMVTVSVAGVTLILLFSSWGGSVLEAPFWFLHDHVPGLGGLRAPTRVAFVVGWFAAVCMASHLDRMRSFRRPAGILMAGIFGAAVLIDGVAPAPGVVDRCSDESIWNETAASLCSQLPRRDVGTIMFLPMRLGSLDAVVQQTLAMRLGLECKVRVVNGYSGRIPPTLAPLFRSPPDVVPCGRIREVIDRIHAQTGKRVLIHLDLGPPLGPPGYAANEVRDCLEPCLAPNPRWFVPHDDRPAEAIVTDPGLRCGQ